MEISESTKEAIRLLEPFGYESRFNADSKDFTIKLYKHKKIVSIVTNKDFLEAVKLAVQHANL